MINIEYLVCTLNILSFEKPFLGKADEQLLYTAIGTMI